ncbi:MAG: hypothetical protein JXM71_04195 [Spirochaetales bacterium]|nr:hypothetical protein [Spirochaetales bacterium]
MKRITATLMLCALALCAVPAEDQADKPAFSASVGPEVIVGINGAFVGGQASFAWQPGFFGIEAGVRGDLKLGIPDAYALPGVAVRLGWLSLGGGAVIRVADAPAPDGYTEASIDQVAPFVRAGLAIPIGPVAVDIGARVMPTDTYNEIEVDDVGDLIVMPFVVAILAVMDFVKLDAGLYYVARF